MEQIICSVHYMQSIRGHVANNFITPFAQGQVHVLCYMLCTIDDE
jgi:hypothetical protein